MTKSSEVIGIIQPFVPSYRRPLFDAIHRRMAEHGYDVQVWHDFPKGRVAARGNADSGEWSVPIVQHRWSIGRKNLTFRNVRSRARSAKAVVAGLASTNIETYGLALDPAVNLMLWGHGRNFTAGNNPLDARIEHWLARRSTHIFTYTDEGKEIVVSRGIDPRTVTVVQNSTDADYLRNARAEATVEQIEALRERHGLDGAPVLLFVGAFDEPKKLPFLFEAMDLVHKRRPDALLVLAGAGPDSGSVIEAASTRAYVKLIGRLEAAELAKFSHVVSLVVMPGRIGLVAVDAMALGLPIATTTYPYHAPEEAYLTDGVSCARSEFNPVDYANLIVDLLDDPGRLKNLADGARAEGLAFSIEKSAERFVNGILAGLNG